MVVSKIDTTISYPEIRTVMTPDKNLTVELYSIEARGVDIVVAIGGANHTYSHKNVVYHPIYLIKSTGRAMQIGVYEMRSTDVISVTDDDGNMDLGRLSEPRLYVFATKKLLQEHRMVPPGAVESEAVEELPVASKHHDEQKQVDPSDFAHSATVLSIPSIRADIFSLDATVIPPPILPEESLADSKRENDIYHLADSKSASWIQQIMKNMNYNMTDTVTNGDCFFDAIRIAFSQLGQITTVSGLRKKLSLEVNEEIYQNYLAHHAMTSEALANETKNLKIHDAEYNRYKELVTSTISVAEQTEYVKQAKLVAQHYNDAISRKRMARELYADFKFMKSVKSVDDLARMIQTPDYWADAWAISTMERVLNVKFIILSSEYAKKDPNNMLQCGMNMDTHLESRGSFEPDVYIMLEFSGSHYRVITYKNKGIFHFSELPFNLKTLIVIKCIERNSGPFVLIPNFRAMVEDRDANAIRGPDQVIDIDVLASTDPGVVFQFYDKSMDKPAGKGSGEKIDAIYRKLEFAHLSPKGEFPNWRRKLDNQWMHPETPITVEDKKWNSVEHFIQASKFKRTAPEFYTEFSADSNSDIANNLELAIRAGSASGKKGTSVIRPSDVVVDPEFHGKLESAAMVKAMSAKFTQIPHFKGLLRATKNATLNHYVPGARPTIDTALIKIRTML